ncbi:MAG: hypothetical protein PHD88_02470 [Firmicutes bacterium]|nr:hypothetical protein [Bacillota bacterium]MDD4263620.1 hypothetical protein [Bacillota bacterium]MDD4693256.1 hypothetical protein [Bacillota bacterium]
MDNIYKSMQKLRAELESYLGDRDIEDNDPRLIQLVNAIDTLSVELFTKELTKKSESNRNILSKTTCIDKESIRKQSTNH